MRPAFLVLLLSLTVTAQQGTAPNGYYPQNYQGTIFTGEVIDGPLDVLTLRYKKGDKQELFTGRFESPCAVPTKDGKMGAMTPADVPLGSVLTVFYYGNTAKKDGQPAKGNVIIGIVFREANGKVIPVDRQRGYQCTQQWTAVYKAFGGDGAAVIVPGPYQK